MRTDKNKFISAKSSFVDKYIAESESEFDGEFLNHPQFENGLCFRTTEEVVEKQFLGHFLYTLLPIFAVGTFCLFQQWNIFPLVEKETSAKNNRRKWRTK